MRLLLDPQVSPLGMLQLVTDTEGMLRALDFEDYMPRLHRLLRLHHGSYSLEDGRAPAPIRQRIAAYFDGDLDSLAGIPAATGGTAFQREVWAALRTIPAGQTMSYGGLAARLGRPGASRAVGLANGSNPVGIVVPCHRVIGAGGMLTGYGGGLARKRWLLDHERHHAAQPPDVDHSDRAVRQPTLL